MKKIILSVLLLAAISGCEGNKNNEEGSATETVKKIWVDLGKSSAYKDCDISYQQPVIKISSGFRVWSKRECPTPHSHGDLDGIFRTEARFYISCTSEEWWDEYAAYYDKEGNLISSFEAKIMGPSLEATGVKGKVINQTNSLRRILDSEC